MRCYWYIFFLDMFSPETIKTNPGSSYEPDESPRCQTGLVSYCLALGICAANPGLEVFSDLNEMAGLSDEEKRHVDMRRDKVADPSLWSKLQPRNGKTNGSDDNAQSYAQSQCVLADCPKVDCVALLRCMHCTRATQTVPVKTKCFQDSMLTARCKKR